MDMLFEMCGFCFFFFFFFSSRRRHTRLTCDWSSDVCSSDLDAGGEAARQSDEHVLDRRRTVVLGGEDLRVVGVEERGCPVRLLGAEPRSEERRVGKECRSRWWPDH